MSTGLHQIEALVAELAFEVVDEDTALGELQGIPTTMTLLGSDPAALMFEFRVDPDGTETQSVENLLEGIPEDQAKISFDDGFVWFSLYDLTELDNSSIQRLLEVITDSLNLSDMAVEPGCVRCGDEDNAQLMYVQGHATRLCPGCLVDAAEEKQELESELNRVTLGAKLGLPGAGCLVAGGWAVFWTLMDLIIEHWQIKVVEINGFTLLLILGFLLGIGAALGWPSGAALRKSIAIGKTRQAISVLFVLAVAIGGEILYVALFMLRMAGIFDLNLAANLLALVVANYTGFWIFCKLVLLATFGLFCMISTAERKTVKLDV